MIPLACRVDYWRNFVSYAPDIIITMMPSTSPVLINLRDYIVQGAKTINHTETLHCDFSDPANPKITKETTSSFLSGYSPIPDTLDKVPMERGWLLSYVQLNLPSIGTTYRNSDNTGFFYRSGSGKEYVDCFNYYLTNSTQRSNIGRVSVYVGSPNGNA